MLSLAKTHADLAIGSATKDLYYTQVIGGQQVVTKLTVPAAYNPTGKDFLPNTPASETVTTAVDTLGNASEMATRFIDWIMGNWQITILGGLALIILIKRL